MVLSIKTFGDLIGACAYIPEARRLLYLLKNRKELAGIDSMWLNHPLPDGSFIQISSLFGNDFINITSPSVPVNVIPIGKIEEITGRLFIIAHVGNTTRECFKKYYDKSLRKLDQSFPVIDDGKYIPYTGGNYEILEFKEDVFDYLYRYEGNGLKVPSVANGTSARSGMRYILNETIEDEMWQDFNVNLTVPGGVYPYNFLQHFDSLVTAYYKNTGKPYVSRYSENGIILIPHQWGTVSGSGVLQLDVYNGYSHDDKYPKVKNIHRITLEGVRVEQIFNNTGGERALLAAADYSSILSDTQRILRADTFISFASETLGEPILQESYIAGESSGNFLDTILRCNYPEHPNCCTSVIRGYASDYDVGSPITNYNPDKILNDTRLPYTIDNAGNMTYVRIEKDSGLTTVKTSLYVYEDLMETSEWESVIDTGSTDYLGPIKIFKTRYRVLQSFRDANFKCALYRKTVYVPDSYSRVNSGYSTFADGRRILKVNSIQTITTFHLVVNGVVMNIVNNCLSTEKWITHSQDDGTEFPVIQDFFHAYPWADQVGDNVTRIFTTASPKPQLLVGYDVYDINTTHELIYNAYHNLTVEYVGNDFPPHSDLQTQPKDRKWLLFETDGTHKELSGVPSDNRVNGLCLMDI